jgi:hypothetical protein
MKLRRVKRRHYRGAKTKIFFWGLLGVAAGGGVAWLVYEAFFAPTIVPPGSIIASNGQVITPAQQAQILTPVSLVS